MQSGYLIVKGLLKKKGDGNALFSMLDNLFDIPNQKEKPQQTQEELVDEFENYIKGA